MRQKTKEELTKLAEILISRYQIKNIKGTGDFLESALVEAKLNKIGVDGQSIKKYEQWLEMKCDALQGHVDYMTSQSKSLEVGDTDEECEDDCECNDCEELNSWYNYVGDVISDMEIVHRAVEIMSRFTKDDEGDTFFDTFDESQKQNKVVQKIPEYTFFAEGEDGLVYIKGKFTGQLVTGKSVAHNGPYYTVTESKYADYILKENREGRGNITEDDASVFIRIALGQI